MYLLILSGMSGAGKSQALNRLEDAGFFCVDNLPGDMLKGFVSLCMSARPPIERAAVVVDSRERVFSSDIQKNLAELSELGLRYEVLFLDCRDDVLARRYNETRRRHPMAEDIHTGIELERGILLPLRETANFIIDTSDLKPLELGAKLSSIVNETIGDDFILTIESFGYKRGVPLEADMVMDMRFSPNPYYEPELKALSGLDAPVREYILGDSMFNDVINETEAMLRKLIPCYIRQDKHRLTVAFGCTGGRHRSVCSAQLIYERMKDDFNVRIVHRDIQTEALDIKLRSGNVKEQ